MGKKGHISGKGTAKHTTVIAAASEAVAAAQKLGAKVSPGKIVPCGARTRKLTFKVINGGWKVIVLGGSSKQELRVITPKTKVVKKVMNKAFRGR